ncbi:hypothetical protein [Streptomyces sp. NBC_00083]|uniref:hypothetical protein n=1 Tax=Streptomyces sp. NBC_00083 TaxID=2975647 RepID=UPI00225952FF|nr:hypothetical protein [Streptomyces sp. NBC_00083]MCX5388251.1 hypothetical protein [Streptomyces sp. NBC_00083]
MAAHASVPVTSRRTDRRTTHRPSTAVLAVPVVLGVAYGVWAAAIQRNAGSNGVLTGGQIVLGVVAGLLLTVLGLALLRVQSALPREIRAAAYATLFGCAMGFLYSLSDHSILRSSGIGAIWGGAMLLVSFYVFYTHEKT